MRACTSVAFHGLRGSGESYLEGNGYGKEVHAVVATLVPRVVASGRSVSGWPLPYSAASVDLLYRLRVDQYLASVDRGAAALRSGLETRVAQCPTEAHVLVGFSQGAMAVRLALRDLAMSADPADALVLHQVVAVGLVGDPTRRPGETDVVEAPVSDRGVATYFRVGGAPVAVPAQLRGRYRQLCLWRDLVCDFSWPTLYRYGSRFHTDGMYATPSIAGRLAAAMLPLVVPGSNPVIATAASR